MEHKQQLSRTEYINKVSTIGHLTEAEERLHRYMSDMFDHIPFHGIIDLAHNASVSKVTIGRFLQKLDFVGYSQFKKSLLIEQSTPPDSPIERHHNKEISFSSTKAELVNYSDNIKSLIDEFVLNVDIDYLDDFLSHLVDEDRKIYVVGPSSSASLASHFVSLLSYIREDVQLLSLDMGKLPKSIINIKRGDMLIVFSYYRFSNAALKVSEWFNRKGAIVSLITNGASNPYGKYSHFQFVLPSETNNVFQSRLIGYLFIEILLQLAYTQKTSEGNFNQLEELFELFDVYPSTK